jgi:allantoinase
VDLVLRSTRVVLPGGVAPASLHLHDGRIETVEPHGSVPAGVPLEDVGDRVIMAGLVDTHVHVNEPGRTEWEGFATATRAAAAGGVTTIVDMPLNASPPTTSLRAFEAKVASMEGKLQVDVGLTGGVVPGNAGELQALLDAGVLAFKCFLVDSGIEDFGWSPRDVLERALPVLSAADVPLLVHAELAGPIDAALRRQGNLSEAELRKYVAWLDGRPRAAENEAVDLVIDLTRKTGARAHVVHLSSADALLSLRAARDAGVRVSAETCPHYLSLAAEDVPDGATAFKCAPPIRERENRERLWQALREQIVCQVVTDHSPAPGALKCSDSGDFVRAWGGIASLELGLSVVWTEARARGLTVEHVAEWMCAAPARLVGLQGRKGRIAPGLDADLVVWEPEGQRVVDVKHLQQRHPITPYAERRLSGVVHATWLAGRKVFEGGRVVGERQGRLVRRG